MKIKSAIVIPRAPSPNDATTKNHPLSFRAQGAPRVLFSVGVVSEESASLLPIRLLPVTQFDEQLNY